MGKTPRVFVKIYASAVIILVVDFRDGLRRTKDGSTTFVEISKSF